MAFYTTQGTIPKKRHTQMRQANGQLYTEELFGREGFSGRQSLLYHITPPTKVEAVRDLGPVVREFTVGGPLLHRHLQTMKVETKEKDAVEGRTMLLGNADVAFGVAVVTEPMTYFYRSAEGDELLFVHTGSGVVETIFGHLDYHAGDYIILPVGTTYRVVPTVGEETRLVVIEAQGAITAPKHYVNDAGQMMEHAPYCERDLRLPRLETHDERGDFEVRVRARKHVTSYSLSYHPFDVVGWDGALYPYIFNIDDFEPITGRIHQPPPVHQTFAGPNFVICSFVPRKLDYHPLSIPVPYHHSNIESDEVIYYVDGQFMSRKGIEVGSVTVHPGGIAHGPQPGVVEKSLGATETAELAVMMDTFHPLGLSAAACSVEDPHYMYSWR
ncbi:homogentisate 1,2-dioxygenase [Sulfoacidibacillus ferrooxidans]|uniref:Homogentisate 1,2-dioxygenase n=1 Tax=Sulfoacidibacillus ferrooxidans TaxID=2005001 RepID=A0A9X1V7Z0_9BACL|nr:homogentisate 1,2-dioxygenase [Sulfoacidibacillus ferrooxidans]MCI0182928.1 Homogentisate 1,2-dioxygenase [Sulfoacidibacillus ferrooxidans]